MKLGSGQGSQCRLPGVMVVAMVCLATSAGVAHAATVTDATVFSDAGGNAVGNGVPEIFDPTNSTWQFGSTPSRVQLMLRTEDDSWTFVFVAPSGQALHDGVYDGATLWPNAAPDQAGLEISSSSGCGSATGRFEVRDIATDADGHISRLWIIYEQHCGHRIAATFGELKVNEPVPARGLLPMTSIARWPANDFGTKQAALPIRFSASTASRPEAVSLGGSDPSSFNVDDDGCSGYSLSAGQSCDVTVTFSPQSAGLETAVLDVRDSDGSASHVPLQGWTYGGTTRLTVSSDPGDFVGAGRQYSFDPSNTGFDIDGFKTRFSFQVDPGSWFGIFVPPQGEVLASGSQWPDAVRENDAGSGPGMEIGGDGRGCNTLTASFTVTGATYDPAGFTKTFGVQFVQHCEGAEPALRGEFDWRLGDTTPVAPWMTSASGSVVPPGESSPPAGPPPPPDGGAATVTSPGDEGAQPIPSNPQDPASPANTPPAASHTATQPIAARAATILARALRKLRADASGESRALARLLNGHDTSNNRSHLRAVDRRLRRDLEAGRRLLSTYQPAATSGAAAKRRFGAGVTQLSRARGAWMAADSLRSRHRARAKRRWQQARAQAHAALVEMAADVRLMR